MLLLIAKGNPTTKPACLLEVVTKPLDRCDCRRCPKGVKEGEKSGRCALLPLQQGDKVISWRIARYGTGKNVCPRGAGRPKLKTNGAALPACLERLVGAVVLGVGNVAIAFPFVSKRWVSRQRQYGL